MPVVRQKPNMAKDFVRNAHTSPCAPPACCHWTCFSWMKEWLRIAKCKLAQKVPPIPIPLPVNANGSDSDALGTSEAQVQSAERPTP